MHIVLFAFWLCFQSLTASQQQPEKAASTATNIVFQSVDGGQSWQDISAGLPEDMELGLVFASDDAVYLGAQNGLYRSTTTSTTTPKWEKQTGLPSEINGIFPGRTGLYATSYGGGIFQKLPGKGTWVPVNGNLSTKNVHSLLETPDGTLFVCCESGIFKSVDSGKTWKQVFDQGRVWTMVAADGVLVGAAYRGVLRSADGGEHWDWVMTEDGAAIRTELIEGGGFAAITFDGMTNRLCTSLDGGKTWQHVPESLSSSVQFMSETKQVGKYLVSSRKEGVFRSSDQGKTWKLVFPSAGNMFILAVSGQVIYAVKAGDGC